MVPGCPSCDEPVERIDGDEMGSASQRFRCLACCIAYERDVSGLLTEVD